MPTKTKNSPSLRFPEFKGEWEQKKLGEITSRIGDGLHGTPIYVENSDIYFVNGNNLIDGKVIVNRATKKVSNTVYETNNKRLTRNSLLISLNGTIGNISRYNEEKIMLGKSVGYFNFENNSDFHFHLLNSEKTQNYFFSQLTGSTIKNLSLKTLRETEVYIPQTKEQTKIASFLTSVDERIQQLKEQKELLEQYKKGLMQKIFSQELRFKDDKGKVFPKWKEQKLGEVSEVIMGQSPSSNSYNSEGLGIPLIQGNADIKNRITEPRNWTTEKTKECKIGDLILTVRAPVGAIAKSLHNACIGRGVCSIRNNSKSNIEFIYQFLLDYETKWGSIEQGSTFTAVSGIEIKKLDINIPCLEEQTIIANFLSAIDDKIMKVAEALEATQQWKKGLLQKLFI
jgi:type I restriction enzyme S subunit